MAGAELPVALETAARIRTDAPTDSRTLRAFKWQLVDALTPATAQSGATGDDARAIQKRLRDAISIPGRALSDELAGAENSLISLVVTPPTPKPGQSRRESAEQRRGRQVPREGPDRCRDQGQQNHSRALVGRMTTLTSGATATEPIIRARLNRARAKRYRTGVLGLRAKPAWDGTAFDHDGTPVTVVACPSVLSIWEAIEARDLDQWTVVLTDVDDEDLGDTVLAHLLDGRPGHPRPVDALRSNSAATIEPALYRCPDDRAVANGLVAALPPDSYTLPPAVSHPRPRDVHPDPRGAQDRQRGRRRSRRGWRCWSGVAHRTPVRT